MVEILQSVDDPVLPLAIEQNFTEKMAVFGRGLPGAELHIDKELAWFYTGRPHLNGVLRTELLKDEPDYINAKIRETCDYFRRRNVSLGWAVGPGTRPAGFGTSLEAHGFIHRGTTTGMAVDLDSVRREMPQVDGLRITRIEDREMLKHICPLEMQAFDSSEAEAQNYYDVYAAIGFDCSTGWHYYLGWLNGVPVAMATLLLAAGVAGIYGVATLPAARRQGIGTAMVLHAIQDVRRAGYRVAVLSPTDMSIRIYRELGFQEYCAVEHYESSYDLS